MARNIIRKILLLLSMGFVQWTWCDMREFSLCHDDYTLDPLDGVLDQYTFPWLGVLYYNHVETGQIYPYKAPRVVLIQKQFVIGTAADVKFLPNQYKLGNVVFGDYERDEEDCGLISEELKQGARCPRASFEIPVIDILPNPEYASFGVSGTVALIKLMVPVKSQYVIPLCLPLVEERIKKKINPAVYLIDYISNVPLDFELEDMAKKTLTLYTKHHCSQLEGQKKTIPNWSKSNRKMGSTPITHVLCTTGCGIRSGAPIISRSSSGRFELIGLATGGPPCVESNMRDRFNAYPPLFVDVFPYTTWIINMITAHYIPKAYPHNFRSEGMNYMGYQRAKTCFWSSRYYLCGDCIRKLMYRKNVAFFYLEKFTVISEGDRADLHVDLQVSAGAETTIECARIRFPRKIKNISLTGIGRFNITLRFNSERLPSEFEFIMALYGKNSTMSNYLEWLPKKKG